MQKTAKHAVPHARTPRFRSFEPRANVAITDRDLLVLALFPLHRFLRASSIAKRMLPDAPVCDACRGTGRVALPDGGSGHHLLCRGTGRRGHRVLMERVGELYAAGYLTRPRAQLDYWLPGGSSSLVYGLSNAGARELMTPRAQEFLGDASLPWSERVEHSIRNATASKRFIHHTLATADLSLALHHARHRNPAVTLLEAHALIPSLPAATQSREFPFKLRANLALASTPQPFAVIPDWAFVLEFSHPRSGRRERRGFLAEIDMGTMPIARSTATGTSLIKKMLVYETAAAADLHKRDLGWQNFRCPIVTTTTTRIDNIRREMAKSPLLKHSEHFYFTTFDALRATENVLSLDWIKPNGKTTQLLPPPK